MEFVTIEGEEKPKMMYTPYIYAKIYDCHACYAVVKGEEIKLIGKKDKGGKYGN